MTKHQLLPAKKNAMTAPASFSSARGGLLHSKADNQLETDAGALSSHLPVVMPKLTIGASNDPLELEADRVADQVLAAPTHPVVTGAPLKIQRFTGQPTGRVDGSPASVDRVLASHGTPLEKTLQADMSQRFGHDFSQVRVHSDGAAEQSAREMNARAYAIGSNVVFGQGQFSPHTESGRRLLAHELTHTIQQSDIGRVRPNVIQRDLAIEPTVADPAATVLTASQMRSAIRLNSVLFTDSAEIVILRDVLGIAELPSVIDEEFVNAVIRYQASFGLSVDGMLGASTAARLEQEITAEADHLAEPATGTPLRRVARRLHLRSMTSRRSGTVTHQGFVGPDDNPEGAVTVRAGDREGASTNAISLEYTGENSDRVDWLQFINMQMFATPPGAAARVFNAGAVGTTGGPVNWSNAATTNWFVDAVPGANPLYNVSGGLNTRAAARRLAMFDEPGGASGLPVAQAFSSPGAAAAGATQVTMRMRFDSYVIRNNRARYHVSWTATTTYDITAATSSAIVYAQGAAGSVTGLRAEHRTALLAEYAGSLIR